MKTKPDSQAAPGGLPMRQDNSLHSLTPAQQEQLFDWLELYPAKTVLEKIAAPPPEGFGINTHLTTLRRFHLRARAHFHARVAADPELALGQEQFAQHQEQLSLHALRQAAIELSTAQHRSPAQFRALAHWVTRLKEIEQRETELQLIRERLALEKEKFQFNAARLAAGHFNEIKDVMADQQTDDEDKIWKIREKIFGPRSLLIEPKE